MKEESLFQQMRFVRKRSLAALNATTEEIADAKPEGFLNNIRWNFGHIFVSQENLLARFTGGRSPSARRIYPSIQWWYLTRRMAGRSPTFGRP
ncbi:DinB family protein [Halobacillus litoralis]|uniref:DinB family protein n=1 Tax=Halobacillus litoralis TaxID=45668 RepID=UPI00273D82EC|nr:DinB family protein [Halobacillus litoralis]WLR46661.1 DinB family protein [Halobacillus litoralis]